MVPQIREVEEQALLLPLEEREVLVERLLRSLHDEPPLPEIDEAWVEEAERRYQEFKEGRVRGIPGDRVFSDIRRELGWQK